MHCYICDKLMNPDEISYNEVEKEWEPCFECLQEIGEAFEDPLTEDELDVLFYEIEGDTDE